MMRCGPALAKTGCNTGKKAKLIKKILSFVVDIVREK